MRSTTRNEEVPPVTIDARTSSWADLAGGRFPVAVP